MKRILALLPVACASIASGAWFFQPDGSYLWVHADNEGLALIANPDATSSVIALTGD